MFVVSYLEAFFNYTVVVVGVQYCPILNGLSHTLALSTHLPFRLYYRLLITLWRYSRNLYLRLTLFELVALF